MQTLVRLAGVPLGWLVCTALRLTGLKAGLAVMYHRVGEPPGDYTFQLVPNLGTRLFEAQVRFLQRTFRLVLASELPDAVAARRWGGRFPAAITFDCTIWLPREPVNTRITPVSQEGRRGSERTAGWTNCAASEPYTSWKESGRRTRGNC